MAIFSVSTLGFKGGDAIVPGIVGFSSSAQQGKPAPTRRFIEEVIVMLGNQNIDGLLAIHEPTGGPAVFFDRAPSDHEGFPFMALQVTPLEIGATADQNKLMRLVDVMFHIWAQSSGHSFEQAQELARLLELTYDRQRVENTEIGACRMFHELKGSFDESTDEDDTIHMLSGFNARGYSTVLQNHLVGVA